MPLQNYSIISKIGSGKYASVYKIKRISDGAPFAMKKILLNRMTPKEKANSLSEVHLLSSIVHPNILSLLDVFYDQFIESLCLVLELAEGDLSSLIRERRESERAFGEEEVWGMVEQVSRGLAFLHAHNIIHRDIKASNILLFPNGALKIGDLNISKINDGLSYTRTGTFTYASPEIWKGERYDTKADIWSFGCLLYELLCLRRPFEGENIEEIFRKISKGSYERIGSDEYSRQLKDLTTFMIQLNPKLRPSAATISKMHRNKLPRIDDPKPPSFNLSSLTIPGLLLDEEDHLLSSATTESTLLKKFALSRNRNYLDPIPTTLSKKAQLDSRQAKSRYNCKNSRSPTLPHSRKDLEHKQESSLIFKRSTNLKRVLNLRSKTEI